MTEAASFDGTLIEIPFGTDAVHSVAVEQYRALLEAYDPEDVLVLTGSPTSMTTFRDVLADECPEAAVPRVSSVIVHATNVINRTDDRGILSDTMRHELIRQFIADWDWEHEYFQRAAVHDSFPSDVGQLIETATWQDTSLDETPALREIAKLRDAFHARLDEDGHMTRSQMITEAMDVLATEDEDQLRDFEAVLVIEFEEFVAPDRHYLHHLVDGHDLVCLAETDASIRRTRTETGGVTDHVSFTAQRTADPHNPSTRPAATATYFARGQTPSDPGTGGAEILMAETADDEMSQVTNRIEQLRDNHGIAYDDIAIGLKYSGDPVIEALQTLAQAGIPTATATVVGFGDDPAIRELLQVVEAMAVAEESGAAANSNHLSQNGDVGSVLTDQQRERLATNPHLGHALRQWATEAGIKQRIATDATPLDARSQFGNLRQAFAIADFVEESALFEATWSMLAIMLTRAHEYAPQQNQTSAIEDDSGVRVDPLQTLKNGSFSVVFLLDLVDTTYPGDPMVSRLFPQERVTKMPDYPSVTQVDGAAVDATFPTNSTASSHPFRQYHAELARRQLAIGASIATDRVYFCLHTHEGTALDERVQPSRFITDAYRTLPWLSETDDEAITTDQAAEEYLLGRIDRALADVRRANSQDVTVTLDDVEAEFAEIQELLADSGTRGDQLREALQARLDFAAGRVSRD